MAGLDRKKKFFLCQRHLVCPKKLKLHISNQTLPNFIPIFATISVFSLEQVVYFALFNHL